MGGGELMKLAGASGGGGALAKFLAKLRAGMGGAGAALGDIGMKGAKGAAYGAGAAAHLGQRGGQAIEQNPKMAALLAAALGGGAGYGLGDDEGAEAMPDDEEAEGEFGRRHRRY